MTRLTQIIRQIPSAPIEAIEGVLAAVSLVFGVIVATPILGATPVSNILHGSGRVMVAWIFIAPAVCRFVAYFVRGYKLRDASTLGLFVAFLFASFARIMLFGVYPLQWLFTGACAVVMGICHLWLGDRETRARD